MRDSLLEKVAKGKAVGLLSSLLQGKWTKGLGSALKEMAGRATMQAGTGAVAGGIANKVRGGSFGSGALSGAMGGFTGGSLGSGLVNDPKKQWLGDVIGGALGGGISGALVPPAIHAMGMEPGSMPNLEGTPQSLLKKATGAGVGRSYFGNPAAQNLAYHAYAAAPLIGTGMGVANAGEGSARGLAGGALGSMAGVGGGAVGGIGGSLGGHALGVLLNKVLGRKGSADIGSPRANPKAMSLPHTLGAVGSGLGALGGAALGGRAAGKAISVDKPKKEEPKKEEPKAEAKPEKKETPKEKKAMANEALETLFNQVYLPAFLEKAAELNLNITTANELEQVLDTTARIKQAMINEKSSTFTEVANVAKGLAEIPQEKEAAEERPSHSQISQFLATNPQMLQVLSAAQA